MSEALDPVETEDVAIVPNEGTDDAQQDASLSAEDRAMAMGWTPQTQFKGDPAKWVDAETFVKRGEEFLPFLKANNRRLEQAHDRAVAKIAALEKAVQTSIQHISRADQRAYAKARADLDVELEQYAAAGNVEAVKAVTKDILDLQNETTAKADVPDVPAEMAAWQEANPWYGTDKALTAAVRAIADDVFEEGYTGKAQLAEVDRRIRAEFPAKFAKPTNPNRKLPGAVEGVGTAPRRSGKTYSDLPPEARAMCDSFVRDIRGFTREKFVADYDWT